MKIRLDPDALVLSKLGDLERLALFLQIEFRRKTLADGSLEREGEYRHRLIQAIQRHEKKLQQGAV